MENFSVNLTWKIFPRRNEPRSSQISNPTYFDVHLFGHCSGHLVAKVNRIAAIRKRLLLQFIGYSFKRFDDEVLVQVEGTLPLLGSEL